MSGGSWDYSYLKVRNFAEALLEDRTLDHDYTTGGLTWRTPELSKEQREARHRFGHLLQKVANAMKAIEWVDSNDSSPPEDIRAIEAVLKGESS